MKENLPMTGWVIKDPADRGLTKDVVYYASDCSEDYVRRAEEIPAHFTLSKEAS